MSKFFNVLLDGKWKETIEYSVCALCCFVYAMLYTSMSALAALVYSLRSQKQYTLYAIRITQPSLNWFYIIYSNNVYSWYGDMTIFCSLHFTFPVDYGNSNFLWISISDVSIDSCLKFTQLLVIGLLQECNVFAYGSIQREEKRNAAIQLEKKQCTILQSHISKIW